MSKPFSHLQWTMTLDVMVVANCQVLITIAVCLLHLPVSYVNQTRQDRKLWKLANLTTATLLYIDIQV